MLLNVRAANGADGPRGTAEVREVGRASLVCQLRFRPPATGASNCQATEGDDEEQRLEHRAAQGDRLLDEVTKDWQDAVDDEDKTDQARKDVLRKIITLVTL